jgi:hypothetical protein
MVDLGNYHALQASILHTSTDPDLLISDDVVVGGITQLQSRSQFSLWSVFPAPLLISKDLARVCDVTACMLMLTYNITSLL